MSSLRTARALAAMLLGACASGPSTAPRHYPRLPEPGAPAATVSAAFAPAPTLQPTMPVCREREPALANAIDDDCDGRIDGITDMPALAVAFPRAAGYALVLRREGQPERALAPARCEDTAPFCTVQLDAATLAGGPYALLARRQASAPRGALVVAVQARGAAATYIAPPFPPEQTERELGRIGAP